MNRSTQRLLYILFLLVAANCQIHAQSGFIAQVLRQSAKSTGKGFAKELGEKAAIEALEEFGTKFGKEVLEELLPHSGLEFLLKTKKLGPDFVKIAQKLPPSCLRPFTQNAEILFPIAKKHGAKFVSLEGSFPGFAARMDKCYTSKQIANYLELPATRKNAATLFVKYGEVSADDAARALLISSVKAEGPSFFTRLPLKTGNKTKWMTSALLKRLASNAPGISANGAPIVRNATEKALKLTLPKRASKGLPATLADTSRLTMKTHGPIRLGSSPLMPSKVHQIITKTIPRSIPRITKKQATIGGLALVGGLGLNNQLQTGEPAQNDMDYQHDFNNSESTEFTAEIHLPSQTPVKEMPQESEATDSLYLFLSGIALLLALVVANTYRIRKSTPKEEPPLIALLTKWGNKAGLSLCLTLCAFTLFQATNPRIPLLDNQAEAYFEDSIKQSVVAYGTCRVINGVVSIAKESELSASPLGVGFAIPVGQVLDPIDDMTERLSSVLVAVITSLGAMRILFDISLSTLPPLISIILLLLIPLLWMKDTSIKFRASTFLKKLCVLLICARIFLPITALCSNYLTKGLEERQASAIAQLPFTENDLGQDNLLENSNEIEVDGFFAVDDYARHWLGLAKEKATTTFNLIRQTLDESKNIISSLLEILLVTVMKFLLSVIILPLLALKGLLALFRYCIPALRDTLPSDDELASPGQALVNAGKGKSMQNPEVVR